MPQVHEEFVRGSVEEVVAHYQQHEPRVRPAACCVSACITLRQGEYVLLLEGAAPVPAGGGVGIAVDVAWEDALTELLAGGMKPSAAAKTVASWFGVSRKQVYSVALMLAGARGGDDE